MEHNIPKIVLKPGKEKQPKNHHPWIFSGAIASPKKDHLNKEGEVVEVVDSHDDFIAYGWCDPSSHIMIRLLSWDSNDTIDELWVRRTIKESVERRMHLILTTKEHTNAFRLIHGEADFLPGVAVDMYGSSIVILISAKVSLLWESLYVNTLQSLLNPSKIYVHIDTSFITLGEHESSTRQYVKGELVSQEDDKNSYLSCKENDIQYIIPIHGQKSGFYCDQRENRDSVASYAKGKHVLDLFSYTGGFSLNALTHGALSVTAVDSSQHAITLLHEHIKLNIQKGIIPPESDSLITTYKDNVFEFLRKIERNIYDLIIVDPPKFASTKSQVPQALKAYKDLNRLAFEKVKTGGLVATFSCSAGVSQEDLQMAVAWAAKDAKKEIQIVSFFHQSSDHPVRVSFPESNYLKGFLLRIM